MCKHENTVLHVTGGWHFSAGEVWDDIETEILCLDCDCKVTEPIQAETGNEEEPLEEIPF